jgi:hypothetical protein
LTFGSRRALLIKLDWNVQPLRANATPMKRRRRSKQGGSQTTGRTSQRNCRQEDQDARWTVKFTKAKPRVDGSPPPADLAIPVFSYQNHISIDRGFSFIRKWSATDAAAYERPSPT